MSIEIKEVEPLHLFSETSHYICANKPKGDKVPMKHIESGEMVELSTKYVEQFLKTADQFTKVVKVGKEDKYWTAKQIEAAFLANEIKAGEVVVGDIRVKGIRTLWEEIHSTQVFTVCYVKQDAKLSKKDYETSLQAQRMKANEIIAKAKKAKKSMEEAYNEAITFIQDNPISEYKEGEKRVLRGYKLQFKSATGFYDVYDADASDSNKIRKVNINSILWLVFDNIKHEVE